MAKVRPRIAPRKPGAAPDAIAQRFVEGGDRLGHQGTRAPVPRGLVARAGGRTLGRLLCYISPKVKKEFEIWCIEHDVSVSDQIGALVARLLHETSSK